jgi:hypothetical protein
MVILKRPWSVAGPIPMKRSAMIVLPCGQLLPIAGRSIRGSPCLSGDTPFKLQSQHCDPSDDKKAAQK